MAAAAASSGDATAAPATTVGGLSLDERFNLIRSVGEECINDAELRNLLEKKKDRIRCYDGFEPSGRMHIAQGIFKSVNVNKCTAAGCTFVFWVADWFALMNDKMGGELQRIRIVGRYLEQVWKAAGMDMANVEFLWAADEINARPEEYWRRVMDIGRSNSLARIKKCCQIMGRTEGSLTSAQILYPLMQCADIFFLRADVCQLGLDQRKVNMLAREYCDTIGRKLKPVILSHHMMSGLLPGQAKMSKSNPDSAIFMEDSAEDVVRKITAAYCPRVKQAAETIADDGAPVANDDKNPCLDYVQSVVFSRPGVTFTAGGQSFSSYAALEDAFVSGALGEADLKTGLAETINALLEPVRQHFATNEEAKSLLEQVKSFRASSSAPAVAAAPASEGGAAATSAAAATSRAPRGVAWLPAMVRLPTRVAAEIVEALNSFVRTPGTTAVLLLPHWGSFALKEAEGEEKDIDATLEYHAQLVRALGLDERVEIVRQGSVILANANDYWLSVIAAGRKFPLSQIESSFESEGGVSHAGQVVGSLMRVADVAALKATHVISSSVDAHLNKLPVAFFPDVTAIGAKSAFPAALCDPKTPVTVADDTLILDDTDMDIRRKIKRAFAAPNDPVTPIIDIAAYLMSETNPLKVTRPAANGGDKDYTDSRQVVADYASGALHPGDLKSAVQALLLAWTERARGAVNTPEMKKHVTVIRNLEKKLAKKK